MIKRFFEEKFMKRYVFAAVVMLGISSGAAFAGKAPSCTTTWAIYDGLNCTQVNSIKAGWEGGNTTGEIANIMGMDEEMVKAEICLNKANTTVMPDFCP